MNFWLITSIRINEREQFPGSSIQNLQTAMALGDLGHRVLVWVAQLDGGGQRIVENRLGRPVPETVKLIEYKPRGEREEKKTPFSGPLDRLINNLRARRSGYPPDAIITRSPRALMQLRKTSLPAKGTKLVLEYQYPEWSQLWRAWRKRNPNSGLRQCVERLREWRRNEDEWLLLADGILYAAQGHEALLKRVAYSNPAQWLPSGCPAPETEPVDWQKAEYDIGYVGSIAPENGLECLLEATARIPAARLLVVGDGARSYINELERQAKKKGVADRVDFAGAVPFEAVRAQMRRCKIGVAPISHRQGAEKRQYASPLKLIEWMAAGVPVIASNVPSVCKQARHGENALLVPPENAEALANAIESLLGNQELAAKIALAGLASAKNASYPNRARLIESFINGLR